MNTVQFTPYSAQHVMSDGGMDNSTYITATCITVCHMYSTYIVRSLVSDGRPRSWMSMLSDASVSFLKEKEKKRRKREKGNRNLGS